MKKTFTFFILIAAALLGGGCDFLQQEPHIIAEETFYTSKERAQLALNGVYGVLNSYQLYGRDLIFNGDYNDDLCHYMAQGGSAVEFKAACYELDADHDKMYTTWTWFYKGIKNANAFMERIVKTDFDPDGEMYAQAQFLRGFLYFELARHFMDVPLRTTTAQSYAEVQMPATPMVEVLTWALAEMEASLEHITHDLTHAPSDVTWTTVHGILGRFYLYMAGAAIDVSEEKKAEYLILARDHCKAVIDSGLHRLNPDYRQIFINNISETYDKEYFESMWEMDCHGLRTSASEWGNGWWGYVNGLRSSSMGTDYSSYVTHYALGHYCNTLKLWDLYMRDDRTVAERDLSRVTDIRQDWNIPPYHYNGEDGPARPMKGYSYPYGGDPDDVRPLVAGVDKTPYATGNSAMNYRDTNMDPTLYPAGRNIGKWRREVQYEGPVSFRDTWNGINSPFLRYADVLLMYAEAVNEINGGPDETIFGYVKQLRDRAGIQTLPYSNYSDHDSFLQLIKNERGRELFGEMNIRKFDLMRWGGWYEAMQETNALTRDQRWSSGISYVYNIFCSRMTKRNEYFPIPNKELAVNEALVQNPLWR